MRKAIFPFRLPGLGLLVPAVLTVGMVRPLAAAEGDANAVPYIATYYVTPTVAAGTGCRIDYYVTDAAHREYLADDPSERFTVAYWVSGERHVVADVPAGDRHIDLPPLPAGNVLFALQATDRQGRKSHRLFQEFRVVDPAAEAIRPAQVLTPDLAAFGIHADDTHPAETTAGLTAMLRWASTNGYRRVVLPPKATFRLSESNTVQMATGLTLDMNGSTFRLNPSLVNSSLMLEFVDCYDSHVVNGVFEGDLKTRDFGDPRNHAEWVNVMSISQGSAYCSVEDVTIRDVTGYGTCTNHRHSYDRSQPVRGFAPGDLDERGAAVASGVRTTSAGFVDIRGFVATHGFFQLGIYLGYQGNPAGHWVYRAHLYDADRAYLETVEGYLYRRLYPRRDACFARITLLSPATPENLCLYNFRAPYNCAYRNVRHENIRCVGMALAGFNNMLVEGCRFENCGWKLARCAFDAEDGWDMMQDLTFRHNVFGVNPANEFLTCGGHNFVMEHNTMKAYIWDRTHGYVFRDNDLKSATFKVATGNRTGYPRIHRNRIRGRASLERARPDPTRSFAVRDSICEGGVNVSGEQPAGAWFHGCRVTGGAVTARLRHCDVQAVTNAGGAFEIEDSRLADCVLKTTGSGVVARISGSLVSNSTCVVQGATLAMVGNRLVNTSFPITGDWSTQHTLLLASNRIETTAAELVSVGNTFRRIELRDNTIHASGGSFAAVRLRNPVKGDRPEVVISGNRFEAPSGWVVAADRAPDPAAGGVLRLEHNTYGGLVPCSDNLKTSLAGRASAMEKE